MRRLISTPAPVEGVTDAPISSSERRPRRARFLIPALLSLCVHGLAVFPIARWALRDLEAAPSAEAQPLELLSQEEVSRLLKKDHPLLRKKKEEEEEEERKKLKGQIVEIAQPEVQMRPKDSKLLSEYDSAVDKQQVSVHKRPPKKKTQANTAAKPLKRPRKKPKKPNKSRKSKNPAKKRGPKNPRTSQKNTAPLGAGPLSPEKTPPSGGEIGGPEHYRALLPQTSTRELAEQSGSLDHLDDDIPRGKETFLNTRAYKYAWFFNRVKREVAHRWDALGAHRSADPYGRVFGVRDRLTVVQVVLAPSGGLEEIFILERSGAAHLDDSAIQAFKDAQPFPNPPIGLRGRDGRVRFKFGFYLEIDGRGGMRFLR